MISTARKNSTAYGQLAELLRAEIRSHVYASGRALPTEAELVELHQLSRQTVRRAFQDLVAEGLVYRIPGRGTFVSDDQGRYLRSSGSIEELLALSIDTQLDVLSPPAITIDIAAAGRLHVDTDRVVSMRFRRLHVDQPYCVTTTYLPLAVGAKLLKVPELAQPGPCGNLTVLSIVQEIAGRPIAGADQTITAVAAPSDVCADLQCQPLEPLLRIDRVDFDHQHNILQLAINHFHPARYTYRFQMKASQ